jgi:hypothetical protein
MRNVLRGGVKVLGGCWGNVLGWMGRSGRGVEGGMIGSVISVGWSVFVGLWGWVDESVGLWCLKEEVIAGFVFGIIGVHLIIVSWRMLSMS